MSLRNLTEEHSDFPPEYCQYTDAGCEFSPSCLNCCLPVCVYDEPGGKQALRLHRRMVEIIRLFQQEGKSVKELAGLFGVSVRTVQRTLKETKGEMKTRGHSCEDRNP